MSIKGRNEWKEKGYHFYDSIRPFKCKHCGKNYSDWHLFMAHYKYYKQKIEKDIMKTIDISASEKYKQSRLNEKLKENKDYQLLQESFEENKRKRPFICNICGKSFHSKKDGLLPHLINVHGINPIQTDSENKENPIQEKNENNADVV